VVSIGPKDKSYLNLCAVNHPIMANAMSVPNRALVDGGSFPSV
jgi:hypothetical protein